MPVRVFASFAEASRVAGVTPATVRRWVDIGRLTAGPWTRSQVVAAAKNGSWAALRGSSARHGTPSRWRAGCSCRDCADAHNADPRERRYAQRMREWEVRAGDLVAAVASGTHVSVAARDAGVTMAAVTAHRRRDPRFAAALDEALMVSRKPDLAHGTSQAWWGACRCPDCRAYHERSR